MDYEGMLVDLMEMAERARHVSHREWLLKGWTFHYAYADFADECRAFADEIRAREAMR